MMNIKGKYRDVLRKDDKVIADSGWNSNDIVKEYGVFLAALMKKSFVSKIGIDYIAVGGSNGSPANFKTRVGNFFSTGRIVEQPPIWAWAKAIDSSTNITYLDNNGNTSEDPTNTLRIRIQFMENEPAAKTLNFEEFALLGIDKTSEGNAITGSMYFIDYVKHRPITKDRNMRLTRTIILTYLE